MATFGVQVTPTLTGKALNITSGSRVIRYLGRATSSYKLPNDKKNKWSKATFATAPMAGSSIFLIPVKFADIGIASTSIVSSQNVVTGYSIDRNTRTVTYNYKYNFGGGMPGAFADAYVFEVGGAQTPPKGSFGAMFQSATDYVNLTDSNMAGCLVWRGTVNINTTWAIPSNVLGRNNAIVFANWSNPNTVLRYNPDNKTIYSYQKNRTQGAATNAVKICVFSSGFTIPVSGYGIAIRNAKNQVTFNSNYPPLIMAGTITLANRKNNFKAAGVAHPMIPLPWSGGLSYIGGDSAGYQWNMTTHIGVTMNGANIAPNDGGRGEWDTSSLWGFQDELAAMTLPYLNADLYF